MSRKGLVTNHLVLTQHKGTRPRYPVPGLLLLSGETIESIILLEKNFSFTEICLKYPEYAIEDLSNYYISPGIIDLNVRHEFETLTQLTKSAIQGGVTVIALEPGYYSSIETDSEYFCDIANIEIISDSYSFQSIPKSTFALKAYLFPPGPTVKSVAHLENILNQSNKSDLPLFIDSTLPDPRMLYMASPLRLENVEDRSQSETNNSSLFAAAFPQAMLDSENSSSESESDKEVIVRFNSLQAGEIRGIKENDSDDEVESQIKITPPELTIFEAKECEEGSPCKIKEGKKKVHHDIYYDLDSRIKASQNSIEDLCNAETSTYSNSGSTSFGKNGPKKCNSFHLAIEKSTESESSEPGSASIYPNPEKKRSLFRPSPILIKPEIKLDVSRDYKYHLSNYPDHWEVDGTNKIIETLTGSSESNQIKTSKSAQSIRIHFQNISSASSLNRVRQIRQKLKNATCEIPAVHLFFTSLSVNISDTRFKNTPPVRNQGNCNLIWDLLKMKGIDCVSSQHASIEPSKKKTGSYQKALNGISSIGCTLQAIWTRLNIPVSTQEQLEHYIVRLAKWLSLHPAKILGIDKTRGSLEEGKIADFIVWKPTEKITVGSWYPYSETSPFSGTELLGCIKRVYLRGELAYFEGEARASGIQLLRD